MQFSSGVGLTSFNGTTSLTNMQVTMIEERSDYCDPLTVVNFVKKGVLLQDNGVVILCGYRSFNVIKRYASIHLNVQHKVQNKLYYLLCLLVLLLVVIIAPIIVYVVGRLYKGKPLSTTLAIDCEYTSHWYYLYCMQAIQGVLYLCIQTRNIVSYLLLL